VSGGGDDDAQVRRGETAEETGRHGGLVASERARKKVGSARSFHGTTVLGMCRVDHGIYGPDASRAIEVGGGAERRNVFARFSPGKVHTFDRVETGRWQV